MQLQPTCHSLNKAELLSPPCATSKYANFSQARVGEFLRSDQNEAEESLARRASASQVRPLNERFCDVCQETLRRT